MKQLALATILVTAACGGGAQAPAPATGTSAATAAQASATSQPSATAASPIFGDLLKNAKLASYKVTYKFTETGAGTIGEQSWYVKPPKSRWDFGAGGDRVAVYDVEAGTYLCTTAGGESQCLKFPKSQALQQNRGAQLGIAVTDKPDQYSGTFEGTRTIAGASAQCFVVKSLAAGDFGGARFCYSAQGVPLLVQGKAQGTEWTMEATAFSTSVSDDDFKLPGRVQELPAIPGYNP